MKKVNAWALTKIMRKNTDFPPNFLKMRIFLSKWANNSPFLTKYTLTLRKIWENPRIFPMIFVSVRRINSTKSKQGPDKHKHNDSGLIQHLN